MTPLTLFDHTLNIRDKSCCVNGKSHPSDPYINLYVRMTNACNAKCKFCTFNKQDSGTFDRYKFWYILNNIAKKVRINKVSFTGGEPTLNSDDLGWCLKEVKGVSPDIFTVLSTNGSRLKTMKPYIDMIDSIALSRHHYDPVKNNEILGVDVDLPRYYKEKVHLSCNLIKGYIDSKEECSRYIDSMSSKGFTDIGFVSLMKVNPYCSEHNIDFKNIDLKSMRDTIRVKTMTRGNSCRCANYLTSLKDGTIIKSYARYFLERDTCDSDETLVFDIDKLKIGFSGKVILT